MLLAAAGTSLGLLLAGCGDNPLSLSVSDSPAPTTTSTTQVQSATAFTPVVRIDIAVHWMDGFCGAVSGFTADNNAMTQPPFPKTPKAAKQIISKVLGDYAANLTKAIDRLTALPPAPDQVGKVAYLTFLGKYTSARDKVVAAKAQLDKAAPTNYAAQNRAAEAMDAAQEEVFSVIDPIRAILSSPTLKMASALARQCSPAAWYPSRIS
jgi:hypothetical protein